MAKIQMINLTTLLEACLAFKKDPTPANELKIQQITKDFVIREYLPLSEKHIRVATIVGGISEDELDAFVAENWFALNKVVYGILSYVTNLHNDLDRASLTPAVVDVLYEMGIIDLILDSAGKDYARLEKMIDETINFSNIFRIVETATLFNQDKLDKFIEEIRSLKTELTPEMLADLKSLAVAGSPEFKALKETLMDEALGRAMDSELASLGRGKAENPTDSEKHPEQEEVSEEKKEGSDA